MRVILELFRIIFIFILIGVVAWLVVGNIYTIRGVNEDYHWVAAIGIYVFVFVLYRNKLQFSGWYKGKGREKLSKKTTIVLISGSVFLLVLPLFLS